MIFHPRKISEEAKTTRIDPQTTEFSEWKKEESICGT
jgi:hypothetical protein